MRGWIMKEAGLSRIYITKIKQPEEDAGNGGDRPASNMVAGWDKPIKPGNGLYSSISVI